MNGPEPFGKYVLMERIAIGGMAEIFRARPLSGGSEDLCIKRILPHYSEDDAFVKMFIDEASIAANLQHENIVQIYDFDTVEGCYYIAMELIEGRDLKQTLELCLERNTSMPVEAIMLTTRNIARALGYAHAVEVNGKPLGIVHRDVSPHNVMLSFNGQIKLTDFGIAKAASRLTTTRAGTVKGKCAYMSPEQARGKTLDGRSDLFSIGILMYEMLTGRRLFTGDSDFDILTKVLKEPIAPPSQFRAGLDPEVERICLKALERDPDLRYRSGEAYANDVDAWLQSRQLGPDAGIGVFLKALFGLSDGALPQAAIAAVPQDVAAVADMKTAMFNRDEVMTPSGGNPAAANYDPKAAPAEMQPRMIVPSPAGAVDDNEDIYQEKTQAMDISQFSAAMERPAPSVAPAPQPSLIDEAAPTNAIPVQPPSAPPPQRSQRAPVARQPSQQAPPPRQGNNNNRTLLILAGLASVALFAIVVLLIVVLLVLQQTGQLDGLFGGKPAVEGEQSAGGQGESGAEEGEGDESGQGEAVAEDNGEAEGGEAEGGEAPVEGDDGGEEAPTTGADDGGEDSGEGDTEEAPAAATTAAIEVTSDPSGASVTINGTKLKGVTPLTVPDQPLGEALKIEFKKDGYEAAEQSVTLDSDREIKVTLVKLEAADSGEETPVADKRPTPEELEARRKRLEEARKRRGNGTIVINAVPWADVTVDGRRRGRTPINVSVPSGNHTIILSNPDKGARKIFRVNVPKDGSKKVFHLFK